MGVLQGGDPFTPLRGELFWSGFRKRPSGKTPHWILIVRISPLRSRLTVWKLTHRELSREISLENGNANPFLPWVISCARLKESGSLGIILIPPAVVGAVAAVEAGALLPIT
jgi:hypothetical protein